MRSGTSLIIVAATFLSLAMATLLNGSYAQPTWNFSAELLPSELYMGEWGVLKTNLTNTDCSARSKPTALKFEKVMEREIEWVEERAKEMRELGKIEGYEIKYVKSYSYQGTLIYDVEFTIYGACSGKSIRVIRALLWFPWKNYGGRSFGTPVEVNRVLKAFNPVNYILRGADPDSSTLISFKIFIPPDLLPEEVNSRPHLDIEVDYPGWIRYTLEMYPTTGPFQIQPYRTFNLTITDYDGVNALSGAKLVIRRQIYYYEEREYIIPENGTVTIYRLPEDNYDVRIYWNSTIYNQEKPYVYAEILSAYDLAASRKLRAQVFNVKLKLLDQRGRPLDGAKIIFDGVEVLSREGFATYSMVPQGNHSLQVFWMDVPVSEKWVWIGYHPTIMPEIRPPLIELKLPIDDLIVQAVDTGGNAVGANFMVKRLGGILSEIESYSEIGLLNISQLPPGMYQVSAVNCSSIFGHCVESSEVCEPGAMHEIQLPVHSASFRILSFEGVPLPNATVILDSVSKRTDRDGITIFAGIPERRYGLRVFWNDVLVYDGYVEISGSIYEDLRVEVYDVYLEFRTMDDRPFGVLVRLVDPSGKIHEYISPRDSLRLDLVPGGECNLTLYSPDNLTIISGIFSIGDLRSMRVLRLPMKDVLVRVIWEDDSPIWNAEVILSDLRGQVLRELTDSRGEAVFRDVMFSNYSLRVNHPHTSIPLFSKNITHSGEPIVVKIGKSRLSVKVVDWLEAPFPKAEVVVTIYGLQMARAETGDDGLAFFSTLPALPAYEIKVKYGDVEKRAVAAPYGTLMVKMDVVRIGGLIVKVSDIFALIPYVAGIAAAASAAIILYRRLVKSKRPSS
ncbi:MAG: hypothetical protein RMI78_00845 [Nitrososphaerota archaeon]|nr:hypothetical protein [Nitrososphaerota archaeon]